ncbi:hypothetical protein [Pediococcus acidilactici]|uniref:hypothetical protein n=1 Tax=Pediococcus acidilactici TaxID=1254 RepID=UPI000FEFD97B|nr:hypothetical protein [Pediococcus acidilactici]RWY86659.1 hypothetical protein EQG54_07955 [Pediococcus acidilactici]
MNFIKQHKWIAIIVVILIAIAGGYRYANRGQYAVQNKVMTVGMRADDDVTYDKSAKAVFKPDHEVKFSGNQDSMDGFGKVKWSAKGSKVFLKSWGVRLATIDTAHKVTFKGYPAYRANIDLKKVLAGAGYDDASELVDDDYSVTLYFVLK